MERKITILTIIALGLLITGLFLANYFFGMANVVRSDPKDQEESVDLRKTIVLTLDRSITESQIKSMELKGNILQPHYSFNAKGKEIRITQDLALVPGDNYTLDVKLTNKAKTSETDFRMTFKTKTITTSQDLPKELRDAIIEGTDALEDGKDPNNVIVKYLPFENQYFAIDYSPQTDGITVVYHVRLKGDKALSKNQLFAWIKARGNDPTKLKIAYDL